jgi:hypothetical protein
MALGLGPVTASESAITSLAGFEVAFAFPCYENLPG